MPPAKSLQITYTVKQKWKTQKRWPIYCLAPTPQLHFVILKGRPATVDTSVGKTLDGAGEHMALAQSDDMHSPPCQGTGYRQSTQIYSAQEGINSKDNTIDI